MSEGFFHSFLSCEKKDRKSTFLVKISVVLLCLPMFRFWRYWRRRASRCFCTTDNCNTKKTTRYCTFEFYQIHVTKNYSKVFWNNKLLELPSFPKCCFLPIFFFLTRHCCAATSKACIFYANYIIFCNIWRHSTFSLVDVLNQLIDFYRKQT